MTSQFLRQSALIAAAFALALTVGLTVYAGVSSAQAVDPANATGAETSTPAPIEGTVGPLEIRDYRLSGGTMTVVVYANEPTAYALSDALGGTRSEGVTEVAYKNGALGSGLTRLQLDVQTVDGEGAVTLATSSEMVRIQTGAVDAGREPVNYGTAQSLLFGAVVLTAGGVYRGIRKRQETENRGPTRRN